MEAHAYSVALRSLIEVSGKYSVVAMAHDDLHHEGQPDHCPECGPLRRAIMVRVDQCSKEMFSSMRDFADRFGF
jgi:hypothetical protein